ncbi:MAG: hypothetical protein EOO72_06795 [Myxococcaceae bacterium]|nr:MAG: hypothetical protein EOO72_06795 [Myxococcaceae bacterium]
MTSQPPPEGDPATELQNRYIAGELATHGFVRPPWQYRADEGPTSMCWRMGGGESHRWAFVDWWESLALNEPERIAWVRRWEPPVLWWAWAAGLIWPELEQKAYGEADEDTEEDGVDWGLVLVERLAAIGIGSVSEWLADVQRDIEKMDVEIARMELEREQRAAALEAGLAGEPEETK